MKLRKPERKLPKNMTIFELVAWADSIGCDVVFSITPKDQQPKDLNP